jgi:hypothetical protein
MCLKRQGMAGKVEVGPPKTKTTYAAARENPPHAYTPQNPYAYRAYNINYLVRVVS